MSRTIACVSMLITLLTVLVAGSLVSAQTVDINYTDRGWYNELGEHVFANTNYAAGDVRGTFCGPGCVDARNFFVFDLTGISQSIESGKLDLFVPSLPRVPGYISSDPNENYELHDVTTSIASLVDGTGGLSAHADLGTGVVYGTRSMTAADMGLVVEITLNSSAIAAMNSARGGLFALGGSVTTLDAIPNFECVFSGTAEEDVSQLRLTLVPEPSTPLLLGIGAISLLGYRKAK